MMSICVISSNFEGSSPTLEDVDLEEMLVGHYNIS